MNISFLKNLSCHNKGRSDISTNKSNLNFSVNEKKGVDWVQLVLTAVIPVVISVILGVFISKLFELENRITVIETENKILKIMKIETQVRALNGSVKKLEETILTRPIKIPFRGGWRVEGIGEGRVILKEINNDIVLELQTNLTGANSFVELFFDVRYILHTGISDVRNNSINLTGKTIVATVSSSEDFRGDINHPNGAQIILKSNEGDIMGPWINIDEAMTIRTGMDIFFKVPFDNAKAKNVTGISLKFTIGDGSNRSYKGSFFIRNIEIK